MSIEPVVAATMGWTPAIANPAATAKPNNRRTALGCGTLRPSAFGGWRHDRGRRRLNEDGLRRDPAQLHIAVIVGMRELGHEPFIERPRPPGESRFAAHAVGVRLARKPARQVRCRIEVIGP